MTLRVNTRRIKIGCRGGAWVAVLGDLDATDHPSEQIFERAVAGRPPHTDAFGDGLFDLRLKGQEGIARVFFCTLVGRRVMVLHSYVKKTQRTPRREIEIARRRMKEVRHAKS